ncbi:PIN domain-containing protein [Actinomadura sp. DC4]|uniref:type II toxin-antitoxin system VapC family toxin n=1 Tax=Actinomadura sp. DC4 TaxID=3055069 RepID=UPI0025B15854|nr:PIN domain-containing protein [Actinomadura sp. DC4]MDN3352872.1 PIN domain-containing protein [Actinomadura sp. DC4]
MAKQGILLARTLVLDCEGLSKAALNDRIMQLHLMHAARRSTNVVVSAVTLTELLRGGPRDAAIHRVVKRMNVKDLTPELARHAGELLGTQGFTAEASIDAMVAATALAEPRPVVILTSDPKDLRALTEGAPGVSVTSI